MTIEHIMSALEQHYNDIGDPYRRKRAPWDRGYQEGCKDGLEFAYRLLERVQTLNGD